MIVKKKKKVVSAAPAEDNFKTRVDKVRKRYEETASDSRWFKPKAGVTTIRILPPWGKGADGSFFLAGALHYGFKIGGRDRAIACPAFAERGRCPVCEFHDRLKAAGGEELKEIANTIRFRKKYWVNVVVRPKEGSEANNKIQMWGTSQKFIDQMMEAFDDEDIGDVTDVAEGHDIKVKRVGTGFTDTRYSFTIRPRPSALAVPDWKKNIHKLDEVVLEWMGEKEIENAIAKNYGDEAAEVGFKLGSFKSKKKRAQEDEDDEADGDVDGEEDDDGDDD